LAAGGFAAEHGPKFSVRMENVMQVKGAKQLLRGAILLISVTVLGGSLVARADSKRTTQGLPNDDFFIISSVDLAKHQVFLKRPTMVTELMRINDKTEMLDEQGHKIPFSDFRSGNTVYVTAVAGKDGVPIVRRMRKGIMTDAELHRRYLSFR
jgi:hypothetical protein